MTSTSTSTSTSGSTATSGSTVPDLGPGHASDRTLDGTEAPDDGPLHGSTHRTDLVGREPGERVDPWWRDVPLDRRGLVHLLLASLALVAVYVPIGSLIVSRWDGSRLGDADADVNRWFEARRTEGWDHVAELGSMLSDTTTKILLGVVLLPVCIWLFRRWHEWAFLVTALVFEAATFATISLVVGRERPPVEQLDVAPTASFPSGHIAAAVTFYGGLAVVMWYRTRHPVVRVTFAVLAVVASLSVVLSRLYRGMHYPSDAVAGVLLGVISLVVVRAVMVGVSRRAPRA